MPDDEETDSTVNFVWFLLLVLSMIIGVFGIIMTSILIHRVDAVMVRTSIALVGFMMPLIILLIPVATLISSIVFNYAIPSNELFYNVIVFILVASICLFSLYIASDIMMDKPKSHKALRTTIKVIVYTGLVVDILCLLSIIKSDEKRIIRFFF